MPLTFLEAKALYNPDPTFLVRVGDPAYKEIVQMMMSSGFKPLMPQEKVVYKQIDETVTEIRIAEPPMSKNQFLCDKIKRALFVTATKNRRM